METATTADTRSLGQLLAAERERQGLARADVAQRLHMSPWQVEAMESGDYGKLPRGPFLRGFVRNYARVLHLDPESLLPLLADVAPSGTAASIVVPSEKIRFDPMGERLANPYVKAAGMAAVFLSLGFAALYWWFFIKPTPPAAETAAVAKKPVAAAATQGAPQQVAVAPMAPAEAPPPVEAPREMPPAAAEPARPEPAPVDAKAAKADARRVEAAKAEAAKAEARKAEAAKLAAAPATGNGAPRAEGEKTIALRFAGESWVEIRDARGRTLMSKLNPAGSAAEVAGRPPFTVIVGNAPEVQMTFDDRPFDLQPHSKVGVARITVP